MVIGMYYIFDGEKTYTRKTLEGARYLAEDLSYKEWCDGALVYNDNRYVGMTTCFRTLEDPNRNFYHQYNVWVSTNNVIYEISGRGELGERVNLKASTYKFAIERGEARKAWIKSRMPERWC